MAEFFAGLSTLAAARYTQPAIGMVDGILQRAIQHAMPLTKPGDIIRDAANVRETLPRDEIIVLGTAYRTRKTIAAANNFWQRLSCEI
jgi:hypothetical protein